MKNLKTNLVKKGQTVEIEITSAEDISKYQFDNPGEAMKMAKKMGFDKIHTHKMGEDSVFMPGESHEALMKKLTASHCGMMMEEEKESEAGYMKVPASEKEQHQKYIANCMSHAKDSVDTEGLDEDRAYMACAIAYDKEYKTAYAPCVPGVGCMY